MVGVRVLARSVGDALRADSRGWLICGAVLAITVVRSGVTYSFGMFVVPLHQKFPQLSLAEQNWIGTLSFCVSLTCAPLSVAFIRSLGTINSYRLSGLLGTGLLAVSCVGSSFVRQPEWFFLTHSLLYGLGSSLIYMSSSLVIGDHFRKDHRHHVLATSILLCGYPLGSLLFNPINAWLLCYYDFRVAFRCSAALILTAGVVGCWSFRAADHGASTELSQDDDQLDNVESPRRCGTSDVARRPEIALWYIGNCFSYLGFYMPFVNLGYYMQRKGISLEKSSIALTLLSLSELVTYVLASLLGDNLKGRLIYANVVSSSCLAVICIAWPFIDVDYTLILANSFAMGGFLGLNIVYSYAATSELSGKHLDTAWSCTNLWSGIGILFSPVFSGAVYELNQSYDQVFIVIGGVYVVGALVFAAAALLQSKRRRPSTSLTSPDVDSSRRGTGFQLSSDVGRTVVDAVPDVIVSNYGTVTAAVMSIDADGRRDDGTRQEQTGTT